MDHLALGNDSSKDAEKRSGGLVIGWTHPEIQRISLPRFSSSVLSLCTLPVMFDAIPDNFDGGHLSSAGDFSFANEVETATLSTWRLRPCQPERLAQIPRETPCTINHEHWSTMNNADQLNAVSKLNPKQSSKRSDRK